MKINLILFLTIFCTMAKSTEPKNVETLIIGENFLTTLQIENTPTINQIKLSFESALLDKNLLEENFQTNFNIQGVYGENKSRQLNQFVPVTSPIKNLKALSPPAANMAFKASLKSSQNNSLITF